MDAGRHHFTLEEANALVPRLRAILLQLAFERSRADADEGMGVLLTHVEALGVVLRDLEQGLVDIPTQRDGEPAWFCWRLSDPEVGFWHSTREGFTSRKPV
jgi:hypothetical protein